MSEVGVIAGLTICKSMNPPMNNHHGNRHMSKKSNTPVRPFYRLPEYEPSRDNPEIPAPLPPPPSAPEFGDPILPPPMNDPPSMPPPSLPPPTLPDQPSINL
jgi:hypothetical protein